VLSELKNTSHTRRTRKDFLIYYKEILKATAPNQNGQLIITEFNVSGKVVFISN
jgi:hypothetical protein